MPDGSKAQKPFYLEDQDAHADEDQRSLEDCKTVDLRKHNREAWDRRVALGDRWTLPVSEEAIAAARAGRWSIHLSASEPVPADWFPELNGCEVLCLASGGGQQAPILAAAGANVTVLDFSPAQLAQDRFVAERDGLSIRLVEGDMADLRVFPDASFDLIVHPVANTYVPEIRPVWAEAYRVLRPGGALLAGFINPFVFIFDDYNLHPELKVRYSLPFSELTSLSAEERQQIIDDGDTLQFSHTLTDQIAGQLEAGFLLAGFYEDAQPGHPAAPFMSTHMATRAVKPEFDA
jgi:SAM-dependent methyltransferase